MFNGSAILRYSQHLCIAVHCENKLRFRSNKMSTYMRHGDEQMGKVHENTYTNRWHELNKDGHQEPDNTLQYVGKFRAW